MQDSLVALAPSSLAMAKPKPMYSDAGFQIAKVDLTHASKASVNSTEHFGMFPGQKLEENLVELKFSKTGNGWPQNLTIVTA